MSLTPAYCSFQAGFTFRCGFQEFQSNSVIRFYSIFDLQIKGASSVDNYAVNFISGDCFLVIGKELEK